MASDTRTLTVSLVAEVASLKKGLSQAQSSFKNFETSAKSTANIVKTAFAALSFGYVAAEIERGVSSMISSFNETRGMIEDTKHLAEALGTTTQDIQVLQRSAGLAEVDLEALNKNLKVMTKNLGAASMGTGPAKDALDAMGLSAQQLIHLPLTEQIGTIAEAMQHIATQGQKASIAASIFGKSGIEMLPFLSEAALNLSDLRAEMEATGEVFTMSEAAIVDDMGDSLVMAMGIWNAFKNQLTIQVAPAIQHVTELMRNWAIESNGGVRSFVSDGLRSMFEGLAQVIDQVNTLRASWQFLKAGVLLVTTSIMFGWHAIADSFNVVMTTIQSAFMGTLNIIAKGIDMISGKAADLANKVPGLEGFKGTNLSDTMGQYFADAETQRNKALSNWGGVNDPMMKSLAEQSGEALTKGMEIWKSDSAKKWMQPLMDEWSNTTLDAANQTGPAMSLVQDAEDILPPLKAQKDMNDEITDQLKEQNDWQKEINKNAGSGTAMRQGEFTQAVGGVYGNGARPAGMGPVSPTSAASGAAITANNTRNGADSVTGLLQGILTASQQIAVNTARAQVAVAG